MRTILLIAALILISCIANAQSYIYNYKTGNVLYELSGNELTNYKTGKTLCKINGDYLTDYNSGNTQFKISGRYINDYKTGHSLYTWGNNRFTDYKTGKTLYKVDGSYITNYKTGKTIYKIEGNFNSKAICYILAIKAFGKKNAKTSSTTNKNKKPKKFGDATGTLEVGSIVAAKKSNGTYIYSSIRSINGNNFEVEEYNSEHKRIVTKKDLIAVPASGTKFKKGDKVLAVWGYDTKFYEGVLGKTEEKGAYVKWNDGSKESLVEYIKIIKK